MSVINQLLLDLEKRRASAAERGALPSHVRALPEGETALNWRWITAGGAAAAGVLAVAWTLFSGFGAAPTDAPAPRSRTEAAIERVVTASAGVATDIKPKERLDSLLPETPAFRMSFELSAVPEESASRRDAEASPTAGPATRLPASRVIGRTSGEPVAGGNAPTAAAGPSERAGAGRPAAVPPVRISAGAAGGRSEIVKQERPPTPRDLADNEYRKATAFLYQDRPAEARAGYEAALNFYPEHHSARQGLVGLMVRGKQLGEAEHVLQEGVRLAPAQIGFTMTLARLQVDRGDTAQAIATLQDGLAYAQGNADYAAFLAALLQRQGRHEEAVEQFQAALRAKPAPGVWWLGLAMSLQAVNRTADAQEAYRRARASNNLHPELAAFAEQRLRQLQ